MPSTVKILGRDVGDDAATFVIAEAGINHNGEVERAIELVSASASAGADAVKFQSFGPTDLMTKSAGTAAHLDAGAGEESVYDFVQRIALNKDDHKALMRAADEAGIAFLSSVFSYTMLELLEELGVGAYKIASMDLNHLPLLAEVARTGKPIILSTGMGTLAEVDTAMETIHHAGSPDVVLLHCVSSYPAEPATINLRAMDSLRQAFGVNVGFSDHTLGNAVSLAAVARGASMIEKHFTLDKSLPGPDQALSADPDEMSALIKEMRVVEEALGTSSKRPSEAERSMQAAMRRSIVSARDLAAGHVLTEADLTYKRPGDGFAPDQLGMCVGRRLAEDVEADTVISATHLA